MGQAKKGDNVKVHYTGKLEDGSIFDTSASRDPIEFKLGDGQLISGFENAVIGMNQDESKTIKIPSDDAYGPHRKELVVTVERKELPENINPKVGQKLHISQSTGQPIVVLVTEADESSVTLDANHPLAGKDLTFEIQLLEIL